MRKLTVSLATAAALALAGTAHAGGPSTTVILSLDAGAGGNAGTSGKIEGGTYALGKNGSDAFARSSNLVETFGISDVALGLSESYGVSTSWGQSLAKTSGQGAQAEAFETRKLKFDNFTRFNVDIGFNKEYAFSGFGGW